MNDKSYLLDRKIDTTQKTNIIINIQANKLTAILLLV